MITMVRVSEFLQGRSIYHARTSVGYIVIRSYMITFLFLIIDIRTFSNPFIINHIIFKYELLLVPRLCIQSEENG